MGNPKPLGGTIPLFADLDKQKLHAVETIPEDQAEAVKFETVDFGDPNRPKTCIENDFPILKVNEIASIESNATKPIYMMSKWWARRRSSVFRQILLSAATRSPSKIEEAAQSAWGLMYRKHHQRHGKFASLKVVDIFMGGGTTVVEAARLGFQVSGVELNPIAWWVCYNELNPVSPQDIQKFYDYIEKKVKPQIMPFFTAESPRGNAGRWVEVNTGQAKDIDPLALPPEERSLYRWEGPEIIYTFWMKHIMCLDPSCFHLTPQVDSAVVAEKSLKIKTWKDCVCPHCGNVFDLEKGNFRMAPGAEFVMGVDEVPFAPVEVKTGESKCPHCCKPLSNIWVKEQEKKKGKSIGKEVLHTLLLKKEWLRGITGKSKDYYGGYHGATFERDKRWFEERFKSLGLVEVRGAIPKELEHTNFNQKHKKDTVDEDETTSSGNIVCGNCGRVQDPLTSIKTSGHLAPVFPYMIQGFDPQDKKDKQPYNGRFFASPHIKQLLSIISEYQKRTDVQKYVPVEELFYGFQTHHLQGGVPNHGYTHWYKMFNQRQLLANGLLLKTICEASDDIATDQVKSQVLGGYQNYLRHNCMFSVWNLKYDKMAAHLSNNNYHPKAKPVESAVFPPMGTGNFASCVENVQSGMEFATSTYDLKITNGEGPKSRKIESLDSVKGKNVTLHCASSTDLKEYFPDSSVDLVVTDPPFGDNLNYSELADFFLVWLQKPLSKIFPKIFTSPESPKALEAVANKARHPGETEGGQRNADVMYDRLLTLCWKEAYRILKPAGLMVFTFHHDKDIAWIGVLESLFKAGFYIEGTFPIRSDSTKGSGEYGSKKIEYDIVHVCRKQIEAPKEIYWATLRRRIIESVQGSSAILAQHQYSGLHQADLEVIIRGEVLEQYSKHYGQVKKNIAGDLMSVKEILVEANSIALSLLQSAQNDPVPDSLDSETRVLFSLFRDGPGIERNAASKRLKGSLVSIDDLEANGWIETVRKDGQRFVQLVNPLERWNSLSRKKQLKSDLDQVHFAISCCVSGHTYQDKPADLEAWIIENYKNIYPSVGPILKYIEGNHFGSEFREPIGIALRTLERTIQRIKASDGEFRKATEQMGLFGN